MLKLLPLVVCAAAFARPVALVNARIYTITHGVIPEGVLVIADGKIVAVGAISDVRLPADFERIDARGKVLMPGIVDTHSHIGLFDETGGTDVNESSGPTQSGVRAIDAILPTSDAVRTAVAGESPPQISCRAAATSWAARRPMSSCAGAPWKTC